MARPTKEKQIAIKIRNVEIVKMSQQTVSIEYLATYFSLTKGQISKIIKQAKKNKGRSPE